MSCRMRYCTWFVVCLSIVLLSLFRDDARAADKFPKKCIPFGSAAVHHSIDVTCGLPGKPANPASSLQNTAKNNFCAKGSAQQIRIADLTTLQQAVDDAHIQYGNPFRGEHGPPDDRDQLKHLPGMTLGEGNLVFFVGYVLDPHYSPKKASQTGESVNCNRKGHPSSDIHLNLSEEPVELTKANKTRELCKTGSAEIIPHYRPDSWDPTALEQAQDHPIKITGQLFFDGSHKPCTGNAPKRGDPARASVWEIHPIYKIDVCSSTDLGECNPNDASVWAPLGQWSEQDFE
jgi:hypothetical protein